MAVLLLLTLVGASLLPEHILLFLAYMSVLSLAFILLAVWKGRPERRRRRRRRRGPDVAIITCPHASADADSSLK